MVCHLAFCVDYPHLGNRNPGAMKLFFVLVLFLVSASFAGGDIMEFMANSRTNLATADGLYEDWIEIHNGSGAGQTNQLPLAEQKAEDENRR